MENNFSKVAESQLYEGQGDISLWNGWIGNRSEDTRIDVVTKIAAICYGRDNVNNPQNLYEGLWKKEHFSVFEFVNKPVKVNRIKHSLRHKKDMHYSPEDKIELHKAHIATLKLKVPIFVARQLMRHRSFSFMEMSRRYTKGNYEFWFPSDMTVEYKNEIRMRLFEDTVRLLNQYPAEIANRFLPQTSMTNFFMQGDLTALKNLFKVRLNKYTQKETFEVVEKIEELINKHQGIKW